MSEGQTDPPLDGEQVAATLVGLFVTVLVAAETVLAVVDILPQGVPFLMLIGWVLWLMKLYAQDRIPPLFPGNQ